MRLLPIIKELRTHFPDIKIKHLLTEYNQSYALFVLEGSKNPLKLFFDYDYRTLEFAGHKAGYGIAESDFAYMISEIKSIVSSELCVVSVYIDEKIIASMLVDTNRINEDIILNYLYETIVESDCSDGFENGYVKVSYINSEKDSLIRFSEDYT